MNLIIKNTFIAPFLITLTTLLEPRIVGHNTWHFSDLTPTSFVEAKVLTPNTFDWTQNFKLLGVNTVSKSRKNQNVNT